MAYASLTAMSAGQPARAFGAEPATDGDDLLMERFRLGDPQAFERLYRRHRSSLHRVLLRLSGSATEADEIFQEVWLTVLRSGDRYSGKGRFRSWLYAIAHRRWIDGLRSRGRRRLAEGAASEMTVEVIEPSGEAGLDAADLSRALLVAIQSLPFPQREAFLLYAEGELTLDEVAHITKAGRETVKSRLRYANQRLRQVVEAHR